MPLTPGAASSGGRQPSAPIIGTATAGIESATISFTPSAYLGKPQGTIYRAISSPGGASATSTGSPITVSGLSSGSSFTFVVRLESSIINSPNSASSNSVVPLAPPPSFTAPPSFSAPPPSFSSCNCSNPTTSSCCTFCGGFWTGSSCAI